jgi:hypothetical protein
VKRERQALVPGLGVERWSRASSVQRQAFSVERLYEALTVEREASVGAEREANMKRALTQEREANVKQALASSIVSGPRFARPCTMLSTMLTLASIVRC